jgi:Rod binding domain-containing protein
MAIALNLNPGGDPAQRLLAAVKPSRSQADKAEPGSPMQKLSKAAQEFEGILLSSWLSEVQKSSLDPSDGGQDAGSETFRSLGNQAVALALAQRGGVGIAQMIVRHFRSVVGGRG